MSNSTIQSFYKIYQKIPNYLKYILILYIITRIVLSIIGLSTDYLLFDGVQKEKWEPDNQVLDLWITRDSGWYYKIAKNGYSPENDYKGQSSFGFFPLYPLTIKIIYFIVRDYFIAGLIVSNFCLILSSIFLYKLVELDFNKETALRSVKNLFLFPVAFILSGVFSESLFLALLLMCFYFAKKCNWLLVGLFGFFLSLTKPIGLLVFIPLSYEYLSSIDFQIKNINKKVLYLFLLPFGGALFGLYNYIESGDFFAYVHAKITGWGGEFTNPIIFLYNNIVSPGQQPFNPLITIFNSSMIVLVLLIIVFSYKKIRFSYWILSIILILVQSSGGPNVIPALVRYCLPIFPFYLILSIVFAEKNQDLFLTIILAMLQGFFMVFWNANWMFIV